MVIGHLAGLAAVLVVGEALTDQELTLSKQLAVLVFVVAIAGAVVPPAWEFALEIAP